MNSEGKFAFGVLVGLAVGAAAAYFADKDKRERFVDDMSSTADKMKDGVVEGYYEAKARYEKYRRKLARATNNIEEELSEMLDDKLMDLDGE